MKIFLAYPFTKLLRKDSGTIDQENTDFINFIINTLEKDNHSVFSAQRREDFGRELMDPDTATNLDFEEIKNTDLVVAFPGQFPISGGVHVELGWASALNKNIILFLHEEQDYSPMIEGLHTVTNVKYIKFNNQHTLEQLTGLIHNEVNNYKDNLSIGLL